MKKIDAGQAISILANLGVLAGLIFVGLQIQQDREIAQVERRISASASRKQWAELISTNAGVWDRGLSGAELTHEEYATFDALARAWQFDAFQEWANSRSTATAEGQEVAPEFTQSFIREAALEIHMNPGLSEWLAQYHETQRRIGRFGLFNELIEAELDRLQQEETRRGEE